LKEENMEWPFLSTDLRSPNAPGIPYVCDDEKTSAVMLCWDAKGFGGEDDVELLKEPCINGLLERFEGLVLLGLGPPAISSFVVAVLRRRVGNKERRSRRVESLGRGERYGGCQKRQDRE
jgi:hypothetical protein